MRITLTTSRIDLADGSLMHSGETHDLPRPLAERLIAAGQAEPAEAPEPRAAHERRERTVRGARETRRSRHGSTDRTP